MKILITGGTGTISSGIAIESILQGHDVSILNRGTKPHLIPKGAELIIADIRNEEQTKKILNGRKFDVVIDCLSYTLQQLKKTISLTGDKCNQFIFISTFGVYSRSTDGVKVTESSEKNNTQWKYAKYKLDCEEYLIKNRNNFSFSYTIVRPSVIYSNLRIPYPIINRKNQYSLIDRIIESKPMIAINLGNPKMQVHITHVSDFARAVTKLFLNDEAYFEDFNVMGDDTFTWDEIINYIGEIVGKQVKLVHVDLNIIKKAIPKMYDELLYSKSEECLGDNSKIKKIAPDFENSISISGGLKNAIQYQISREVQTDSFWDDSIDFILYLAKKYSINKLNSEEKLVITEYFDNNFNAQKRALRAKLNNKLLIPKAILRKFKALLKR